MHHFSSHDITSLLSSISRLADRMECRFEEAARRVIKLASGEVGGSARCSTREFARGLLRVRRRRSQVLGLETLRDPAWDMLLDLYGTCEEGEGMMVSSLCFASGVPQTTALRHLARLEQQGLVERRTGHADRRRTTISLTPEASARVERLLAMMQESA